MNGGEASRNAARCPDLSPRVRTPESRNAPRSVCKGKRIVDEDRIVSRSGRLPRVVDCSEFLKLVGERRGGRGEIVYSINKKRTILRDESFSNNTVEPR